MAQEPCCFVSSGRGGRTCQVLHYLAYNAGISLVVTGESSFLVASLAYAIYSLTEVYNPEEYNSVPMQGFFGELIKIFFLINNMELLLKKMELLIHKTVAHVLKKALHSDVNEVLQKAQRAITVLQSGNRINNDCQFKVSFQIKLPT